jgi:hypothetical protein
MGPPGDPLHQVTRTEPTMYGQNSGSRVIRPLVQKSNGMCSLFQVEPIERRRRCSSRCEALPRSWTKCPGKPTATSQSSGLNKKSWIVTVRVHVLTLLVVPRKRDDSEAPNVDVHRAVHQDADHAANARIRWLSAARATMMPSVKTRTGPNP